MTEIELAELATWLRAIDETATAPGVDLDALTELVTKGAHGFVERGTADKLEALSRENATLREALKNVASRAHAALAQTQSEG